MSRPKRLKRQAKETRSENLTLLVRTVVYIDRPKKKKLETPIIKTFAPAKYLYRRVNGKVRRRPNPNANIYGRVTDRGNVKISAKYEYVKIKKTDLIDEGALKALIERKAEKRFRKFSKTKALAFGASVQIFSGPIKKKRTISVGKETKVSRSAKMLTFNRLGKLKGKVQVLKGNDLFNRFLNGLNRLFDALGQIYRYGLVAKKDTKKFKREERIKQREKKKKAGRPSKKRAQKRSKPQKRRAKTVGREPIRRRLNARRRPVKRAAALARTKAQRRQKRRDSNVKRKRPLVQKSKAKRRGSLKHTTKRKKVRR